MNLNSPIKKNPQLKNNKLKYIPTKSEVKTTEAVI